VYSGTGPVFRWQNNFALNWSRGEFGAGLAGHHKTGYVDQDPTNHVASYTTFDGYLSWKVLKNIGLSAGVRNMFDRNPPLSYQTETFQAGYDPRYADPIGRTLYARATYSF
jgi:iron complex outermembrane receptor protein